LAKARELQDDDATFRTLMPGAIDVLRDVKPHRHGEAVMEVNLTVVLIGIFCCCRDDDNERRLTESDKWNLNLS
jgi:hypothetical protein